MTCACSVFAQIRYWTNNITHKFRSLCSNDGMSGTNFRSRVNESIHLSVSVSVFRMVTLSYQCRCNIRHFLSCKRMLTVVNMREISHYSTYIFTPGIRYRTKISDAPTTDNAQEGQKKRL